MAHCTYPHVQCSAIIAGHKAASGRYLASPSSPLPHCVTCPSVEVTAGLAHAGMQCMTSPHIYVPWAHELCAFTYSASVYPALNTCRLDYKELYIGLLRLYDILNAKLPCHIKVCAVHAWAMRVNTLATCGCAHSSQQSRSAVPVRT